MPSNAALNAKLPSSRPTASASRQILRNFFAFHELRGCFTVRQFIYIARNLHVYTVYTLSSCMPLCLPRVTVILSNKCITRRVQLPIVHACCTWKGNGASSSLTPYHAIQILVRFIYFSQMIRSTNEGIACGCGSVAVGNEASSARFNLVQVMAHAHSLFCTETNTKQFWASQSSS